MSLLTVYYHSSTLSMASVVTIVVPNNPRDADVPLVMLLSPEGREARWWLNACPMEHLADIYGTSFVLVPARQGCHVDMKYGYEFFQQLSKEIPHILERFFPIIRIRENKRYAAGVSIGGLGAFKLALLEPGTYTAAASFSGRLDITALFRNPVPGDYFTEKRLITLFGTPEDVKGSENDLTNLTEQLTSSAEKMPAFYLSAHESDIGYEDSKAFYSRFNGILPITWVDAIRPEAWGEQLEDFLKWITGKERR